MQNHRFTVGRGSLAILFRVALFVESGNLELTLTQITPPFSFVTGQPTDAR